MDHRNNHCYLSLNILVRNNWKKKTDKESADTGLQTKKQSLKWTQISRNTAVT